MPIGVLLTIIFNCCCSGIIFFDASLKSKDRGEVVFIGMFRKDVEIHEGSVMDTVLVNRIKEAAGKTYAAFFKDLTSHMRLYNEIVDAAHPTKYDPVSSYTKVGGNKIFCGTKRGKLFMKCLLLFFLSFSLVKWISWHIT